MGCEYCKMWSEENGCSASLKYRENFCGVTFPNERTSGRGSNYTPPKKKRKKKRR